MFPQNAIVINGNVRQMVYPQRQQSIARPQQLPPQQQQQQQQARQQQQQPMRIIHQVSKQQPAKLQRQQSDSLAINADSTSSGNRMSVNPGISCFAFSVHFTIVDRTPAASPASSVTSMTTTSSPPMTPQQFGAGQTRSTSNNQRVARQYSRPPNVVSNVQRAPLSVVVLQQYPNLNVASTSSSTQFAIPQVNDVAVTTGQTRKLSHLLFESLFFVVVGISKMLQTLRKPNVKQTYVTNLLNSRTSIHENVSGAIQQKRILPHENDGL